MKDGISHSGGVAYIWICYGLAWATTLFFAIIFGSFMIKGLLSFMADSVLEALPVLVMETGVLLGSAGLVSVPFAFLMALFLLDNSASSRLCLSVVKSCVECPKVIFGVALIYAARSQDHFFQFVVVISALLIPRLAYGWFCILSEGRPSLKESGLALGMSSSQILFYLYLPRFGARMIKYALRVLAVLVGAVAPFVYLTSLTFLTRGPQNYFSLEVFRELIRGNDQTPVVWVYMFSLTVFTFLFAIIDSPGLSRSTTGWSDSSKKVFP